MKTLEDWSGLWIAMVLAGWFGAGVFFTIAVAPAIFSLAREPGAAGAAIASLLTALHIGGACLFLSAAAAALVARRSRAFRFGLIALAGLCLLSHFGVSRPLAELRERNSASRTAEEAARFRNLHRISVGFFGVIAVGSLTLLVVNRPRTED